MSPETADIVIKDLLAEIRMRLDNAAGIARAAQACADAGNPSKAIEIVLDVEPLIHEANTLLNGASLINLISKS